MLSLSYNSKRPVEKGNFYLELIDCLFVPNIGLLEQKINRLGYWCDLAHLETNLSQINKQILKIKEDQNKNWLNKLIFILQENNIIEIISDYTELKDIGNKIYIGQCPFCNKKDFKVNGETQKYSCSSCKESGVIFNFLMKKKSLTLIETIKILAKRAGTEI